MMGTCVQLRGICQPSLMDVKDCLTMNLAWTRVQGPNIALQMIFGMTGTSISRYLRFMTTHTSSQQSF